MSRVQAKTCREGGFFFPLSLPLFWLAQSTGAPGRKVSLHAEEKQVTALQTCCGAAGYSLRYQRL